MYEVKENIYQYGFIEIPNRREKLSPLRTLANAEQVNYVWSHDGKILLLIVKYKSKNKYSNEV